MCSRRSQVSEVTMQWTVSMALPGIDPKNVEINMVGRTLRVRGERPFGGYANGVEPVLSEISYGTVEREFTLPEDTDQEKSGGSAARQARAGSAPGASVGRSAARFL